MAETVLTGVLTHGMGPLADSGYLARDLRAWTSAWASRPTSPEGAGLVLALTATTVEDQASANRLYQRFTEPRDALLVRRLRDALVHLVLEGSRPRRC